VLTGILDDGAHDVMRFPASHGSVLSGMVRMYVLMSAFNFAPWLKLISSRSRGFK